MATVEITFKGVDKTTNITKDISGEITDLEKTAKKSGGGIKNAMGVALGVFTGGAMLGAISTATGAVTGFLTDGFADAKGAAILMAQTEAVIKSTGGAAGVSAQHVADYASSLSDAAGQSLFGDDQIQESTNLLLTFKEIKGATLDAATAISVDMAQALGGAPADAAVQLGKALNDPIAGISALSRVGVTFSEDQKAVIQSLVDTGDMAGAQAIILNELESEFGGSAAAAAAAAGPLEQFKGQMGELGESIMARLLPSLNEFGAWLASPEVQASIQAFVDALMNGIGGFVTWFQGTAWPILQEIFAWIKDTALPALQSAFETVWPMITAAVKATYTFLAETVWPWLRDTAWPWLKDVALPALQRAFEAVWPAIKTAVNATYTFLRDVVWAWLRDTAWPWIQNVALPALQRAWETAWPAIKTAVNTTYTFLRDTVWPWLQTAMSNIGTWITTAKNTWTTAWGSISNAVTTAKNTISSVIGTIKSLVQDAIGKINELIGLINNIPGVNIPTIPGIGGGGGSGFGGNSIGPRVPLGGGGGFSPTFNIDARGASMTPSQFENSMQRVLTNTGFAADIRNRVR